MATYTPDEDELELIRLLEEFSQAIQEYEYGEDPRPDLRSWINQHIPRTRSIIQRAGAFVTITIGPPPAIGGMIHRGLDPFQAIFTRPYMQSMVPTISDMIDQTIGLIRSGEFKQRQEKAEKIQPTKRTFDSNKVFIVHGHAEAPKQSVARLLEKLKLEPVILHEQSNKGQTIIEKLERNTDVAFAVVLLTPDDVGCAVSEQPNLKPRARQNVILELGYLTAKLSRSRVCAVVEGSVERPSDFDGVLYVPMQANESWKFQLAKEMKDAGLPIDLNKVI